MLNYNLSYSAIDVYKKSQLQFYFWKVANAKKTDKGMDVYGEAGNTVHNSIEEYISYSNVCNINFFFEKWWNKFEIDDKTGMYNSKLKKTLYKTMLLKAKELVDNIDCFSMIPELSFNQIIFGVKVKGSIDLFVNENDGTFTIYDWKTNSTNSYEMHKYQRLFYSWALWKIKGIIPTCKWFYLRNMKIHTDKFTVQELEKFDKEIENLIKELQTKGNDITKYSPGKYKNPFNKYYTLCKHAEEKRFDKGVKITLSIHGNTVKIIGNIPRKLLDGINFSTQFDLPNKYHMQKYAKKKGWKNIERVGTVFLYNSMEKSFPIGLLDKVKKIIRDYESYYDRKIKIIVRDNRDQAIMNFNDLSTFKDTSLKLRDYQIQAVDKFMEKETGILNMPTGSGKTFTAGEIIRRINGKTLWIIDRKELLQQTKKELEKLLGIEVGTIYGGKADIKDVTIATIQSLNSKIDNYTEYLNTVNFVILDEYHKTAAKSYQNLFKYLPNTKYKLGLTGTVGRDDGTEPILFSLIGEVIYKVDVQKLIDEGYLVKPKIQFIELPYFGNEDNYQEDYKNNIVQLSMRNQKIRDICLENKNKKILILTKLIDHGKLLKHYIYGSEYLYGSLKKNKREQIMENFRNCSSGVLIITQSIGSEGLDIPDLDIIINVAGNKGDVKSIQMLGRVLRTFKNKKECYYYDFIDSGKYTKSHSMKRITAFQSNGHEVKII